MSLLADIKKYISKTNDDWNYITPLDFYNNYYLKSTKSTNKKYVLIDLRKPSDYKKFHIKGAKNIFWLELFNDVNLKKISKDTKIFLICYVGHTSSQTMTLLKLLGYDVTSIKFGYGISPVKGVPVAGWLNYDFPVVGTNKK